jgi:hypothetical protein
LQKANSARASCEAFAQLVGEISRIPDSVKAGGGGKWLPCTEMPAVLCGHPVFSEVI